MIFSRKIFPALLLVFLMAEACPAQEILLQEEPQVSRLMENWVNSNRNDPRVEGWRVQIMASTDRIQVEQGRTRFRLEHPEIVANWVQEQPYYKLRVGAFREKQEALAFIAALTGWAGAYPVRDAKIHPRDFLEQ